MNRTVFILTLFAPFVILAAIFPKSFTMSILPYLIILYVPTITIIRMKHIKFTWKEVLYSFIPFYGFKYRFKVFTEK